MPSTSGRSDETALIRAAQKGDPDAFEQLVRSYDQNVLRMALNLLHSQEDARDVYQEAFLRVYRNLPNFRFDCSCPLRDNWSLEEFPALKHDLL